MLYLLNMGFRKGRKHGKDALEKSHPPFPRKIKACFPRPKLAQIVVFAFAKAKTPNSQLFSSLFLSLGYGYALIFCIKMSKKAAISEMKKTPLAGDTYPQKTWFFHPNIPRISL